MAGKVFARTFDKVWVSGGSSGIGLGIAREFLSKNQQCKVWVTSRRALEENDGLSALEAEFGRDRIQRKMMDIRDESSVEKTAAEIAQECGKQMDAVINTVGLLHGGSKGGMPEKRLKDIKADWVMENFRVNALGPLLLAQHVVLQDVLDRSKMTLLASISAKVGSVSDNRVGSWYSYRASKAAQNMVNRCMAIELTRMKRSTVCIGLHPGTVDTQLSQPFSKGISHEIFSVEKAAKQLIEVIENIDPKLHHGQLLNWDGTVLAP